MTSPETRRTLEVAGLAVISDLVASLAGGAPVDETVSLICRTIRRIVGFRFCGVLMPDSTWSTFHLAGGDGFPPAYVERLNELFLVPVGDQQRDSPTRQAAELRRTVVNADVLATADFAPWQELAQRFGYRSMVSVPLIISGQVLGVLNGYSTDRREFTTEELASIETLAAQAAVSLRISMLMEAQQDTISNLTQANSILDIQRHTLERAHEIHQRLTAAALTGSDPQQIASTLAELIGSPVAIAHPDGSLQAASDASVFSDAGREADDTIIAEVRIPGERLGYVITTSGESSDNDLRRRAVEHAATVLALEAVKDRVVRATEDRLRSDFIAELVRGRLDDSLDTRQRAVRHGLNLQDSHRVAILRIGGGGSAELSSVLRELQQLPKSLAVGTGTTVTAIIPSAAAPELSQRVERIRSTLADCELTLGIGAPTSGVAGFDTSHRGAELCLDLARRLGRTNLTLVRDELGLLAFFVDTRDPEELVSHARQVLGAAIDHDRKRAGTLVETITTYLENSCDAAVTAKLLFVHANTVKYRLRQVEQLCRIDLRRPDDLLQARIATLTLRLM